MDHVPVQSPERVRGSHPLLANSNAAIFQFRLNHYRTRELCPCLDEHAASLWEKTMKSDHDLGETNASPAGASASKKWLVAILWLTVLVALPVGLGFYSAYLGSNDTRWQSWTLGLGIILMLCFFAMMIKISEELEGCGWLCLLGMYLLFLVAVWFYFGETYKRSKVYVENGTADTLVVELDGRLWCTLPPQDSINLPLFSEQTYQMVVRSVDGIEKDVRSLVIGSQHAYVLNLLGAKTYFLVRVSWHESTITHNYVFFGREILSCSEINDVLIEGDISAELPTPVSCYKKDMNYALYSGRTTSVYLLRDPVESDMMRIMRMVRENPMMRMMREMPEMRELDSLDALVAKASIGEAKAKALQRAWARHLGRKVVEEVDLGGGVTMEFVLIPPGKFQMGSPKNEKDRSDDEEQHEVEITRAFYLGKYEVTQEQYEKSADGLGKERVKDVGTGRFPVEGVSWEEAVSFCRKLTDRDQKRRFRLPSEAEWEYACRAGTETPFHFGLSLNGDEANCNGNKPYGTDEKGPYLGRTRLVGSYAANAFGLCDMHGNVWEWCQDYYGPYKGLELKDPLRTEKVDEIARVLRGGSWGRDARNCRAANRRRLAPGLRNNYYGFRVAFRLD